MTAGPTPVTSRRELAKLLRELRAGHGLPLEEVCSATGISASFLSRVERGQRGLGDANAQRLCDVYKVPLATRARVRQLASLGREGSWWDDKLIPRPIREYIGVEQAATSIASYGSIIPGLFQTRAYVEAAMASTQFEADTGVRNTATEQRLRRQDVLNRADPPWVHTLLDESVLHRVTGGVAAFREQLEVLQHAGERPRVTIQVIPFQAGAHPGVDSRFVIVSTSEDHTPELVHVEGLSGFRNFEKPEDLGHYARAFRILSAVALTPSETRDLLTATIARLDRGQ
ncbi:helix-turn-helix transcriptional regulator [Pseudonocardia sp. DSM 110487]|uniref:helix-turn-helix domain-containing protein n=1 Tax=Pseudonocardia sp. DSM 110487 TaxID=2865833 RepID=UPI001C6A199C|nr:helix-turn-helix transcriptional regulator [Pseudonocardia sp. DSM 110487]QYN37314.1 helix-turn-helix transcriptional regulator [Pseudonocardia sp. DSM 110487]